MEFERDLRRRYFSHTERRTDGQTDRRTHATCMLHLSRSITFYKYASDATLAKRSVFGYLFLWTGVSVEASERGAVGHLI